MTYKATPVYIVMRHDTVTDMRIPVAVFDDMETASGNADGYNLDMQERKLEGLFYYVAITTHYV